MNDYSDIRSHERYHLKNHIPMPWKIVPCSLRLSLR